MKKRLSLLFVILSAFIFLNSCKKNSVQEEYTETVTPVIPDLTTQVIAGVAGFITDNNGDAIEGASVKGGNITVLTDNYGYFKISNASFAKSAGFIQVTKAGYFTAYRTFLPVEAKETFIRLQLIPKIVSGIISSTTGGTVSTIDGAIVTLPSNAVVIASSNIVYTGNINVSVHWLNPIDQQTTQLTMPGDLRGIDSSGYLKTLTTYGMLAVELSSDAGEKLQIAPGKKASLSFPIPASLTAAAPSSIPLWYFDETKALWIQQGTAIKNGNNYQGDVSHFTFWNCDIPSSLVNFSAQLLDLSLNPLAYTAVSINITGVPNSGRTGFTDANGNINGMVPANSDLTMNIVTMCNSIIPGQNFTTTNSNINLGSIKIDPQLYGATFKGTVNKCNGSPVTNGYVIIAGGYNQVVNIENGIFNAAGLICATSNAAVVAFDRDAAQQSNQQNFSITPGTNDFGILSACNAANTENITYILDGVTTSLTLPQYMFVANYGFTISNTDIKAIDLLNGSITVFYMNFISVDSPGSYVFGGFSTDREYQFVNPTSVVITAYGLVGQFITGSFSGEVKDLTDNSIHTFSCSINIKRDS